jgi:hypothetical protein
MDELRTSEELKEYILGLNKLDGFSLIKLQKKLEIQYEKTGYLSILEELSCVVETMNRRAEMN